MTKLTWNGQNGDWYDPSQWTVSADDPAGVPEPGDEVVVAAGAVALVGSRARQAGSFDDVTVRLGSSGGGKKPSLIAKNADFGIFFDVAVPAGETARMVTRGTSGFDGSLDVKGTLDLDASDPTQGENSTFVFTSDAFLTVYTSASLVLSGDVKLETGPGQSIVDGGATLVVDGSLTIDGATLLIKTNGSLTGSGTIDLGYGSVLDIRGLSANSITIRFAEPGSELKIGDTSVFNSVISGFSSGDAIDRNCSPPSKNGF